MIVGDIGPVEVELIYTLIFLVSGLYFGGDSYDKTLFDVAGIDNLIFGGINIKYFLAGLTIFLALMFSYDSLK